MVGSATKLASIFKRDFRREFYLSKFSSLPESVTLGDSPNCRRYCPAKRPNCQKPNWAAILVTVVSKVNDGGFYYAIPPDAVDPSQDERYTANGGLRSYGSMSYAGFKSLIYAGLTKEDPRVKAVLDWIGKNYSVTENHGAGDAGLYYYYHSFAAALNAAQMNDLVDDAGKAHGWSSDLVAELAKRQYPDGSWTNQNRQWFENDPNLSTAFALIALSYCDATPRTP